MGDRASLSPQQCTRSPVASDKLVGEQVHIQVNNVISLSIHSKRLPLEVCQTRAGSRQTAKQERRGDLA